MIAERTFLRHDFGIGHGGRRHIGGDDPGLGGKHGEVEHGLEVRLVETWEYRTGMVGNEKRVEIVLVAVERLVAAGERHVYGILTVFQPALFQYDMLAAPFGTPLLAVHCHHTAILSVGSL